MRFWWDAVNNSKCRNEKDAQKRQFCDFSSRNVCDFQTRE